MSKILRQATYPMLRCFLEFLGFRTFKSRKPIGVKLDSSVSSKYPNLIIPEISIDKEHTCLVYDSVNALLDSDRMIYNKSEDIIEDFVVKYNLALSIQPDDIPTYTLSADADNVFAFLNSLLNLAPSYSELSAKTRLLTNLIRSLNRNSNMIQIDNATKSLNNFYDVICFSLITKFNDQYKDNVDYLEIPNEIVESDHQTLMKIKQINAILDKIEHFNETLKLRYGKSTIYSGEDLRGLISLIENHNKISFNYNEKISELVIILDCFSYISDQAKKEQRICEITPNHIELETCITNIIVYLFKFLSFHDPHIYEVAFKRCLIPFNLKMVHEIKNNIFIFRNVNFFDFDYKNYQYGYFLGLIATSNSFCEEIEPYGDFYVKYPKEMENLLEIFNNNLDSFLQLEGDLGFEPNLWNNYEMFLKKPEDVRFQRLQLRLLFTEEQINDMILFSLIDKRECERRSSYEIPEMTDI